MISENWVYLPPPQNEGATNFQFIQLLPVTQAALRFEPCLKKPFYEGSLPESLA